LSSTATDEVSESDWRYVLRLLGARDRSEHEVRERLEKRGLEPPAIDTVVKRLYRYRYLDDERFADAMARRAVRRGYGSRRVRVDLRKKGIAKALIDTIVGSAFEDEPALARRALSRRYKGGSGDDKTRARAARFLLQRGFPQRLVLAILKEGC
jgi:regulatory protein